MVASTRVKNKLSHPATPVMTNAAKQKAGIKTKQRPKRITKDQTIKELQARLDALENPDEEPFSKDPLFLKGSSPPLEMDDGFEEHDELPTEVDSDDRIIPGQKRTASGSLPNPRALKRTKGYSALEDVQPTLQNKPSGLRPDWRRTTSKAPASRQQAPNVRAQSSSSSMLTSPTVSHSSLPDDDHTSSLLAISPPPILGNPSSSPFYGKLVPLIDKEAAGHQGHPRSIAPFSLPRAFKDEQGRGQQPGLKDLPNWLRDNFRNSFIRRVIEQVCLTETPWHNPALSSLQRELNYTFPTHRIRLHSDDAAVIPTLCNLGVLRNQIGNEGLNAVIEYLPSQYNKRMLRSKDARAKYIATILSDSQRPFIWEYFRPGTIPLAGECAYYDEKRRGPFQSEPVLRAFSVYFTSYGIQAPIPTADPGDGLRPIGALALAATAVERGYCMHDSGDYVAHSTNFSSSKWLSTTDSYVEKIQDLTDDNWTQIFQGLDCLQTSRTQADQIQLGAPLLPKQRETLLPADPPTPPPSD